MFPPLVPGHDGVTGVGRPQEGRGETRAFTMDKGARR